MSEGRVSMVQIRGVTGGFVLSYETSELVPASDYARLQQALANGPLRHTVKHERVITTKAALMRAIAELFKL